MTPRQESKTTY